MIEPPQLYCINDNNLELMIEPPQIVLINDNNTIQGKGSLTIFPPTILVPDF